MGVIERFAPYIAHTPRPPSTGISATQQWMQSVVDAYGVFVRVPMFDGNLLPPSLLTTDLHEWFKIEATNNPRAAGRYGAAGLLQAACITEVAQDAGTPAASERGSDYLNLALEEMRIAEFPPSDIIKLGPFLQMVATNMARSVAKGVKQSQSGTQPLASLYGHLRIACLLDRDPTHQRQATHMFRAIAEGIRHYDRGLTGPMDGGMGFSQ